MRFVFILALLLNSTTTFAQGGAKIFTIYFEQNGKRIDIVENEVNLKSAPFTIVINTKDSSGILVNGSFNSKTYKAAIAYKHLTKLNGFSTTGMAEGLLNSDTSITLSEESPGYWFYDDYTTHRYNEVIHTDSGFVFKRIIKKFDYDNDKPSISVEGNYEPLYLVFITANHDEKYNNIEVMRVSAKLNFIKE